MNYFLSCIIFIYIFFNYSAQLLGQNQEVNRKKGLNPDRALSQYHVNIWSSDHGLPTQGVNGIIQSNDGFIWLATYEGLFKFDGITFNNIIPEDSEKSLAVNSFKEIYIEPCGKIWMAANGGGLISYHEKKWKIYTIKDGLPSNIINTFHYSDKENKLWVGTSKGVVIKNGDTFEQKIIDEAIGNTSVNDILEDNKGDLWFATSKGLVKTDKNGNFLKRLTTADGLDSDYVTTLMLEQFETNDYDNIWIGTDKGVKIIRKFAANENEPANANDEKLIILGRAEELKGKSILKLHKDLAGNIWIGTNRGLFRFYGPKLEEISDNSRLPIHTVTDIAEDQQGNIWVSTYRNGFYQLVQGKFITYSTAQGLTGKTVYGVIEVERDSFLIATNNGLTQYKQGWNFSQFKIDGQPFLYEKDVRDLFKDSKGNFWFATTDKLYQYNQDKKVKVFSTKNGLSSDYVRVIYEDSNGNLWLGTDEGVNKYNGENFEYFSIINGLSNNRIHAIFEDSKGIIWISTEDGLNKITDNGIEVLFMEDGLAGNVIFKLYEDQDNTIWVGTNGGISRIKNGKISSINRNNKLHINSIFDIIEDKNGYFWIPNNQGIYRIEKEQLNLLADGAELELDAVMYKKGDGMMVNACTANARSLVSSKGEYWLPTPEGVTVIPNPEILEINNNPPRIAIESIQIDGEDFPYSNPLHIPSGDYQLNIKFTGLEYHSPERVSFSYALGDFVNMPQRSNKREAVFTNIPPGKHTFRILAFNNDNIPSDFSFPIIKERKFTEKPLFYLVSLVGATLILTLVIRQVLIILTKKVKVKNKLLEQKVKERTDLINEQKIIVEKKKVEVENKNLALEKSNEKLIKLNKEKNNLIGIVAHDLKSPLNHITGLINIIKLAGDNLNEEQNEYIKHILDSTKRLNEMISQILDVEALESGNIKLNLSKVDLYKLVDDIISNHNKDLERKKMALIFDHNGSKFPIKADQKIVEQIFDNLISNAIKFTPYGKKIIIRMMETKAEYVRAEIKDEGPGVAPAEMNKLFGKYQKLSARPTGGEHSTGLGLSIVKKYVELLGGKVWCESEAGKGANFIVELKKESNKELLKNENQIYDS